MGNFTASVDLETLLDNVSTGFDNDNVAGLDGLPDIRLEGNAQTKASQVYGEIIIKKGQRIKGDVGRSHGNLKSLIQLDLLYKDQNNPPTFTIVRLMMDELERVLDLCSQTAANGYVYEIISANEFGGAENCFFKIEIEATQYYVRKDGS